MDYFLKGNKNLLTYTLITFIIISIFGLNFYKFLSNILLLLFLIPLYYYLYFLYFLTLINQKSICSNCGAISIGLVIPVRAAVRVKEYNQRK